MYPEKFIHVSPFLLLFVVIVTHSHCPFPTVHETSQLTTCHTFYELFHSCHLVKKDRARWRSYLW